MEITKNKSKELTILSRLKDKYDLLTRLTKLESILDETKVKATSKLVGANCYSLYELTKHIKEYNLYDFGRLEDYVGIIPEIAFEKMEQVVNTKRIIDLEEFGSIDVLRLPADTNLHRGTGLAGSHKISKYIDVNKFSKFDVLQETKDFWSGETKYYIRDSILFTILASASKFIKQEAPEAPDPIIFTIVKRNDDYLLMNIHQWT